MQISQPSRFKRGGFFVPPKARAYFWRCKPGNPAARKAVKEASFRAFCKSPIGKQVLALMKQASHNTKYQRLAAENASYAARGEFSALFYMIDLRDQLLSGKGGEDHLSVLHSWMGHLLYIAMERAKKLPHGTVAYQELRQNTMPRICRGRRALMKAWVRWVNTKHAGFSGIELHMFKQGFDESCLLSKHTSRKEIRAAFAFADRVAKAKGYKVVKTDYKY